MKRDTLLSLYDRLTGLVARLPGGLQKPILNELVPIRELFLEQRPARILLTGRDTRPVEDVLAALGARDLSCGLVDSGWRRVSRGKVGSIDLLDAREGVPDAVLSLGLGLMPADLVLILPGPDPVLGAEVVRRTSTANAPVVALAIGEREALAVQASLAAEPTLSAMRPRSLAITDPSREEVLCATLPLPAQLEFARLTGARRAQAHIAASLLKSFSAVCGVIGMQPIPLADMPVLTTLQMLMIGLIIHTSGRTFSPQLVAEFTGALGLNIGAGLVLREGARAIIRIVPIWGNAVSGFIAGAGTYAIGRAAIAYFIEELPAQETRRMFARFRKSPAALPPGDV